MLADCFDPNWRTLALLRRTINCWLFLCGTCAAVTSLAADPKESVEGKYLANLRQITFDFVKAGEGYFSGDAMSIIFQAQPKDYPFYQIYVQPLGSREALRVSTGRGRTTCAYFHPDGKRILFASSHSDPNLSQTEDEERKKQDEDAKAGRHRRYEWIFDSHMDLYEANLDGSDLRPLTREAGYDAEGSYSPDGKRIVFCSDRDGDPDLYIMDADGKNVRQLTTASGYDGGPFFSPDGQRVIFRSDRKKEGFLQIYVIDADGKNERALTDNVGVNWAPYWHPSEPYIIWAGADHSDPMARPNYDLWLMRYERRSDGIHPGPITRVTDSPSADVLPVFTPDGKQLMWTSTRTADRSSQLWYADFTLPKGK